MADAKPEGGRSKSSETTRKRDRRKKGPHKKRERTPAFVATLDAFVAAKMLGKRTSVIAAEWGVPVATLYQMTMSQDFKDEFARARAERLEMARAKLEEAAEVAVDGLVATIISDFARRPEACAQILDRVGLPRLVRTASTSVSQAFGAPPGGDAAQPAATGGAELRMRSQADLERFLATGSWEPEPSASTG